MPTPRAEALLRSPIALELVHLLEWRGEVLASLSDEQLFVRANEARLKNQVYRVDYDEHLRFLQSRASKYAPTAEEIGHRMDCWWTSLDRDHQIWASSTAHPPDQSLLVPDLSQMHAEASKPHNAFWTCTFSDGLTSPWLRWGEHYHNYDHAWQLVVSDTARVAEIHSPEDWRNLCLAYPAEEPGYRFTPSQERSAVDARLDPAWTAVARDLDGVHLSMGGLLTAQDVPCAFGGIVTELRGWDLESTIWLRWVFDSVEGIPGA